MTSIVTSKNNELVAEQFTDAVLDMYAQFEALKQQKEMFEFKLRRICEEHGIKKVDSDYWSITFTPEHEQRRMDTEKIKETDLYMVDEDTGEFVKVDPEIFIKTSKVKESVKVKIK